MKFDNTEVFNFEGAFRGLRNPMNSWDKSDSVNCKKCSTETVDSCPYLKPYYQCFGSDRYIIGDNDMKLAQKLIKAGSEHRKFMRQIFISVDITAPLYWWKEADTYKVGTVANSTSTMHKLATTPITKDCFEVDDEAEVTIPDMRDTAMSLNCMVTAVIIPTLEKLRVKYLETKDKSYWKELIRWLPESYLQKRTVTMSYENVLNIVRQRKNHKLNEWSGIDKPNVPNFISWARTLPYASELIFIDENEIGGNKNDW